MIEAHLEGGLLSILAAFVYVMAILDERSGE